MSELIPVVHVINPAQAMENVEISIDAGCSKVFLINHGPSSYELIRIYHKIREAYPSLWIGLNLLGLSPIGAARIIPLGANALWTDGLDNCHSVWQAGHSPRPMYFGGVAFKYQPAKYKYDDEYDMPWLPEQKETKDALEFVDVVTTSGPATGEAPSVHKIRAIKEAAGAYPVAIASGVSEDNIKAFLSYAEYFLAATSISRDFYNLDPSKVASLVDVIRTHKN